MKLNKNGMSQNEIVDALKAHHANDLEWRDGKSYGYVYHASDEVEAVAKKAIDMYVSENALDFSVYPSMLKFENDLVGILREHLSGDQDVVGSFTSGGTESILLAVKTARDYARENRPEVKQPQMVLPVTAHAAFHKAAAYFDLKIVPVSVNKETFTPDPADIESAITDQTILVVASAPSYAHGVVDPIEAIGEVAAKKNVLFHVDACVGGFLLPYFRKLGQEVPAFDFSVKGVTSISVDLHKYAFAPKGASIVLYRNAGLRKHQFFACAQWTGYSVVNQTIQSSKSGAPLAAAWAVMSFIGDEGYLKLTKDLLATTKRTIEGINQIEGLQVLGSPTMSLFAFTSKDANVFAIADEMTERGWFIQPQLSFDGPGPNLHLTIAPQNVGREEAFLTDLKEATAAAKVQGGEGFPEGLADALGNLDPSMLEGPKFLELLQMAGIEGTTLPKRRQQINELLNALPRPLCEKLLTEFTSLLYSAR